MLKVSGLRHPVAFAICLMLAGCGSGSSDTSGDTENSGTTNTSSSPTNTLSGLVQKGNFLADSSLTVWQLDENGQRTNTTLSVQLQDSSGRYEISPNWVGWSEVQVQGRYFDEFTGQESTREIGLSAVVDLVSGSNNKNINLLTHLHAARAKLLAARGMPVANATSSALSQTRSLSGVSGSDPGALDLTQGSGGDAKNNATLLLFSGAFLANDGDTATLERMANDFADDGQINGEAQAEFTAIGNRAGDETLIATLATNLKTQGVADAPDADDLGTEPLPWVETQPTNSVPQAVPQELSVDEDTSLNVTLSGTDADGDTLTFSIIGSPANGSLSGTAPNLIYTPKANFSGMDSFTFKVNDGAVDSALATISLTIKDNDADNDDVLDAADNCPSISNPDQLNTDGDAQGNVCDEDDDNDGVIDAHDEKPLDANVAATLESAHRVLLQTTFGPTFEEIKHVEKVGVHAWIDEELARPSAYDVAGDDHQTHVERLIEVAQIAEPNTDWSVDTVFNKVTADHNSDDYHMAVWWENVIGLHPEKVKHGSDQLRQRVAFALSQLLVVSNSEAPLDRRGEALAYYYDILTQHAFGNYRDLIELVAKSPAMGIYLSHQGNRKANPEQGTRPDENFAREIMQLFTIGLYQLNIDGSANKDGNPETYPDISDANPTPTYDQLDIEELAKVMTGWDLADNTRYGKTGSNQGNFMVSMEFNPEEHEDEAALGGDGDVTVLGDTFALDSGDGSGMDAALDTLFSHENMGPMVSKHLIMRLVTSNPSSDYVARVARVFNNNGSGVRGDLKAVTRAILIDEEARGDAYKTDRYFGKAKEPLLAFSQLLRTFGAVPLNGWIGQDKTTPVNGIYWFRAPEQSFAQGALRAHSVFNFYSPDFVPSDTDFALNKKVSPEMQIQTDQMLVEYSNRVFLLSLDYEKTYRSVVYKTKSNHKTDQADLAGFAASKSFWNSTLPIINYDRELELFEQALEGDANGDFSKIDDEMAKQAAISALISHFDQLLLGNTMSIEYRAAMKHYLLEASGLSANNNVPDASKGIVQAFNIIQNAVRLIATSSSYMIQK